MILAVALLLAACAMSYTPAYHEVVANIPEAGTGQVAVATHDQRPYVLSGNKTPQFVGLHRDIYGIPRNVKTEDGRTLAEGMTQAIANSFKQKGFLSISVAVPASDPVGTVREKLVRAGAERAVLLTLREWKTDTYTVNTSMIYDVTLSVLDRSGQLVGESQLKGDDELGGDPRAPTQSKHIKKVAPAAFKAKLEQLLGSPAVVSALGPPP